MSVSVSGRWPKSGVAVEPDDDDKASDGGHFTWRSSRWISLIISSAYALDIFAWTSVSTIDLNQELTLIEWMFHLKNFWLSSGEFRSRDVYVERVLSIRAGSSR